VSGDREESGFKEYLDSMPWLAVPFSEEDRRSELNEFFEVRRKLWEFSNDCWDNHKRQEMLRFNGTVVSVASMVCFGELSAKR
jgi:hypothetical protein